MNTQHLTDDLYQSDETYKRVVGESDAKGWATSRGYAYWEVSAAKGI